MLGKIEMILVKACVVFTLIIAGSALVSICMDKTLYMGKTIRDFAQNYFGFDVMPLGIAGIIMGSILMAAIDHYERKGGIS